MTNQEFIKRLRKKRREGLKFDNSIAKLEGK